MADCVVVAAAEELVSHDSAEILSAESNDLRLEYEESKARFDERIGLYLFRVAKRLQVVVYFSNSWLVRI